MLLNYRLTTRIACLLIACNFLFVASLSAAEEAARTEAVPFLTQTLSDTDFLSASKDNPMTIAGVLRIPTTGGDKLPAVIMLHGSGGYTAYIDAWVARLNAINIATFVVDSFSGRGLRNVRDDQNALGRLAGVSDAYGALEAIAKNPRIDESRIVLMGFSRGGQGALYAAMKRFHESYLTNGLNFAGYIAFYPNCSTHYRDDLEVVDKPIKIYHGEADDFNAYAPCKAYAERLIAAGKDVQITGYPGAYHVFDWDGLKKPQFAKDAQSARDCKIEEGTGGVLINKLTDKPFTYQDDCVAKGATAAYNEAAANDVSEKVPEFLSSLFMLPSR